MRSRKDESSISTIASFIDNTLLRPDAPKDEILQFCKNSSGKGFATVCVHPCWISLLKKNFDERLATAIGFPLGANSIETKVRESEFAVSDGADELDAVMNIGRFKSRDYKYVESEIKSIVKASGKAMVKIIIETGFLTQQEVKTACSAVLDSGADYVKTSTGLGPRGASVDDIKLMKKCVGTRLGIKASGGIRNLETAISMIKAGATRIGTSSGLVILEEFNEANKVSKTRSG